MLIYLYISHILLLFTNLNIYCLSYTHRRPSLIRRLFVSTSNLRDIQFCLAPDEIDSSINRQESISEENDLRNEKSRKEGWLGYISVCGWLSCFCYGLTTLTWQGFRVFTDFWLTRWTDNAQQKVRTFSIVNKKSKFLTHSLAHHFFLNELRLKPKIFV